MLRKGMLVLGAGVFFAAHSLTAGDAAQTEQVDDSNSHTYRSPRAERRYDNRQQAIEQKQLNNETAKLKAATAQANEQAKKDELKSKVVDAEQKRKDEEQARKDAAQAKREAVQEKKDAANLSDATLPAAENAAQQELSDLGPLPAGVAGDVAKALRSKALTITLEPETVALWELCARDGDFAKLPAASYNVAMLVKKGTLALIQPLDPAKAAPVPDTIQTKAGAATGVETLDQDLLGAQITATHAQKKLYLAGPAAALIAAWGDEKFATIIKDADAVIVPVEKWCLDDKTVLKTDYVATVLKFSAAIRKLNPKAKIFLEVGAKADATVSSGTAEEWLVVLGPVVAKNPAAFDGVALVTVKTKPTDDPKLGLGAIKQMFAWLRPVPPPAKSSATDVTSPAGASKSTGVNAVSQDISADPNTAPVGAGDSVEGTVGK